MLYFGILFIEIFYRFIRYCFTQIINFLKKLFKRMSSTLISETTVVTLSKKCHKIHIK